MIRMRRRRGFTLIEVISVMGVFSILMSIAVAWIVQTMRYDTALRSRLANHKTLMLLDRQLRADIRRGQSMLINDGDELIIQFDDNQSATYRLAEHRMEYQRSTGRRETYRFWESASARWELSDMPNAIGLIVERNEEQNETGPVDLCVRGQIRIDQTLVPIEVDNR
jgi:prepilin-type N-terminal cleavage/methylation domain-containing protein